MTTLIFATATRLITGLMLVFSIFILLRGHNEPGGGFIGGLIAVTAFALYAKSRGIPETRSALVIEPTVVAVIGLGCALVAGLISFGVGDPFLTGQWVTLGGDTLGAAAEMADAHGHGATAVAGHGDVASHGEGAGHHKGGGIPISTVLLFDTGVYLVVVGAVLGILFAMEEEI